MFLTLSPLIYWGDKLLARSTYPPPGHSSLVTWVTVGGPLKGLGNNTTNLWAGNAGNKITTLQQSLEVPLWLEQVRL